MRHSLNLNILRTGRSLHPYWLIFVISDEMIPPSFLCHLEQSMQCHLPSLIIMSIGVRASVRPSREAERAPCDPPLATHAVSGRAKEAVAGAGGDERETAAIRRRGKTSRGAAEKWRQAEGERKEKRREGDFAENMMAVCSSR